MRRNRCWIGGRWLRPTGTDESTARTITIQADVNYGGKTRTYEYDALVLCEDGKWAVDPDSLSTGVLVEAATPTPDPNVTPTPTPEPTPTPTPGPKTKLYYNKSGGKFYMRIKTARRSRASICPWTAASPIRISTRARR